MKDPERMLAPGAPTAPRLRALLEQLVPKDLSEEADERLEARIQGTLEAEARAPRAADGSVRSTG